VNFLIFSFCFIGIVIAAYFSLLLFIFAAYLYFFPVALLPYFITSKL